MKQKRNVEFYILYILDHIHIVYRKDLMMFFRGYQYVCRPYGWVFLGSKILKQGLFTSNFPSKCVAFAKIWKNIKNGYFSAKIHHKSGYEGKFW